MAGKKRTRLALVTDCIVCSGGIRDANGAFTVCALCELEGKDAA